MPLKMGGGNELQEYDSKNGEYCRNKQCEEDEKNLILKKIFGVETNIPISFPIPNIHDDNYCENFIKLCTIKNNPIIADSKFTNYLFISKNNKANFLMSMGYTIENYKILIKQIINGTNFKNIDRIRNKDQSLTFETKTRIYNFNKNRFDVINTIWCVEHNLNLRFVTLKGDK